MSVVAYTGKLGRSIDTSELIRMRKSSVLQSFHTNNTSYKKGLGGGLVPALSRGGLSSDFSLFVTSPPLTNATFTIVLPTSITINLATSNIDRISWGDGSTGINGGIHTYPAGTYTITAIGTFTKFPSNASFTPYISNVASIIGITDMTEMFLDNTIFNQNISDWNVSKVTSMRKMFSGADLFNQPIGTWNVSNVIDMYSMFQGAASFNGNIFSWNTSNVINMSFMFSDTTNFNKNIGSWNVSKVNDITYMFFGSNITVFGPSYYANQQARATALGQILF